MTLRALCCLDMGAALSHHQEGVSCEAAVITEPPTMADVIRERKKKAGGAGLGTLRRKIVAAARRPRDQRPDRENSHARYIRSVVSSWRLAEVFLLLGELEAASALRDLCVQGELAREPAPPLREDLQRARDTRLWCDVELSGCGWSGCGHRGMLAARTRHYRDLLRNYPPGPCRLPLDGPLSSLSREEVSALIRAIYGGDQDKCESSSGEWCSGAGAAAIMGLSRRSVAQDMAALLHSGCEADVRLVFSGSEGAGSEGAGSEGAGPEGAGPEGAGSEGGLRAHRFVLAARSRFFRNILSRGATCICLDAAVVPPRFGAALLHAAYTDQVDLSLIGRSNQSPSSGNSGTNSWGAARGRGAGGLEDAFALYEVAKFLELPIAVQGCEDVIAAALSADTLPTVLAWSQAPHASAWLRRQCHRYLLDEFPAVLSSPRCAALPQSQLSAALASNDLQACELQVIKGLLKWAEASAKPEFPPGSAARRRRGASDALLRRQLAALVPHVRTEHLPPDHDLLPQLIRRGIFPASCPLPEPRGAEAWLGRAPYRALRCYQPYLDELRALLEDQEVPEAELARLRRAKYSHRIPDTLYMVSEGIGQQPAPPVSAPPMMAALVGGRTLRALVRRARELQLSGCAMVAGGGATRQIALRAVREASLPDECAALLLEHLDCCDQRDLSRGGSARCSSASLRSLVPFNNEGSRCSTGRRELPIRPTDPARQSSLSRSGLPDVALAPNGNTHLLTPRDYYHHLLTPERAVLQLDLGDGATHTPRPGSRAQRAGRQSMGCQPPRAEERPDAYRSDVSMPLAVYDRRASPGRTHRQAYLEVSGAGNMSGMSGGGSGGGGGHASGAYESGHYRQYRLSQCSPSRGPSPRPA